MDQLELVLTMTGAWHGVRDDVSRCSGAYKVGGNCQPEYGSWVQLPHHCRSAYR